MITVALIVISAFLVLADATKLGIRTGLVGGPGNLSPKEWFVSTLLLWIIGLPLYLAYRQEFMMALAGQGASAVGSARWDARATRFGRIFAKWVLASLVCFVALSVSLSADFSDKRAAPVASAPAAYIKNIAAYVEGYDGLVIYIILADAQGAMTTASGTLDLVVSQTETDFSKGYREKTVPLFEQSTAVKAHHFRDALVGKGAFEHEVTLYSLERIPYSSFHQLPSKSGRGKVTITFTTEDGRVLTGEEAIYF